MFKKNLFLGLFLFVNFVIASTPTKKEWTHIYYLNYDNQNAGDTSINPAEEFIKPIYGNKDVNTIIHMDNRRTYILAEGITPLSKIIKKNNDIDSASEQTFIDLFNYVLKEFPSKKIMLTIICPDEDENSGGVFLKDYSSGNSFDYEKFSNTLVKINQLIAKTRKTSREKNQLDIISIGVPNYGFWTEPPVKLLEILTSKNIAKVYMTQVASMGTIHAGEIIKIKSDTMRPNANLAPLEMASKIIQAITSRYPSNNYFKGFYIYKSDF